jgi:hypothetical protein
LVEPGDSAALMLALDLALDRGWNARSIAETAGRTWDQAAAETYRICEDTWERARGGNLAVAGEARVHAASCGTR